MNKTAILLSALFCLYVQMEGIAQKLEAPGLEFVCELKVTTANVMVVGETGRGKRQIIPITGGTFEGPKLKGEVINGGADWQLVNANNTVTDVEAHYTIKTDDGVFIDVRNMGLLVVSTEESEKLTKGLPVDWTKIYFRAAPKFDAPKGKYDWMNNALYICKGVPMPGYVSIQVWKVL